MRALENLPMGWCVYRTETGWAVGEISNGFAERNMSIVPLAEHRDRAVAVQRARAVVARREAAEDRR